MSISNKLQEFTVLIDEGSGCLFQPMTDEYSYILTANHVIEKAITKNASLTFVKKEFIDDTWHEETIDVGILTEDENYFKDETFDVAIIKCKYLAGLDYIYSSYNYNETNVDLKLCGYPSIRDRIFRENKIDGLYGDLQDGYKEAQIENFPGQAAISGQSGGGIFSVPNEKCFLLIGIQKGVIEEREDLGRVKFIPLKCFDSLVKKYPEKLSELLPSYLKCFSFLKNEIFNLDASFHTTDIEFAANVLKGKAQDIVNSNLTPFAIKNLFKEKLLFSDQKKEVLQDKMIWKTWLEFLIIMNIIKYSVFDENEVNEIFNSYRLLFSSTDKDWSSEIENILYSDYKGLKEDSNVIIGISKRPGSNQIYKIQKGRIPNLGNIRKKTDENLLLIDTGITNPFDSYNFIHIASFKEIIESKFAEYRDLETKEDILTKLKAEYESIFQN